MGDIERRGHQGKNNKFTFTERGDLKILIRVPKFTLQEVHNTFFKGTVGPDGSV